MTHVGFLVTSCTTSTFSKDMVPNSFFFLEIELPLYMCNVGSGSMRFRKSGRGCIDEAVQCALPYTAIGHAVIFTKQNHPNSVKFLNFI